MVQEINLTAVRVEFFKKGGSCDGSPPHLPHFPYQNATREDELLP